MNKSKSQHYSVIAALLLLLSGCASTSSSQADAEVLNQDPRDPLESINRSLWDFNFNVLDKYLLKPVTQGYVAITPMPVRSGLRNAIDNLAEPTNVLNNAAQGNLDGTMVSAARFMINSTVGLLGVIDVADYLSLPSQEESFGETLAVYGIGTGPYLMVPARGPTDIRSTTGDVVDSQIFPMQLLNSNLNLGSIVISVLEGRAFALQQEANLSTSFDPYAFVKNAYFENLEFKVNNGDIPANDDDELLEDFENFDNLFDEPLADEIEQEGGQ